MTKNIGKNPILLLIDGNSLLHRAYHALPPLTDKNGEMANAVFGFSNMLLKAIDEVKPTHVACTFDTAAPTFRHIEFEKYKAQRKAPPPDLYPQLPKVKKVLDAFGIPYFEKEGYEADDLLATIAVKIAGPVSSFPPASARSSGKSKVGRKDNVELRAVGIPSRTATPNFDVVILSGDRDVLQLVDGNIKVQMPSFALQSRASDGKPGWGVLMGAREVREKFGLETHQMVDYKSLIGDPSDNIPGIAGIGPKTAAQLLQKYHTLENLFEHVKETPLKVQEKLEKGRDIALAAKRLVELDRNVDLKFNIGNLKFDPDWDRVRAEYERLGFKSIAAKIPGVSNTPGVGSDSLGVSKIEKQPKNNDDQLKLI